MNGEPTPPELPGPEKENAQARQRPRFFWMVALGVVLLLGLGAVCFRSSNALNFIPFGLAALGSFISVFFKNYRGIFFGFYITIGVLALVAIVLCFFR